MWQVWDSRSAERGWVRAAHLTAPAGLAQHCSAVVGGDLLVTGGRGRGDRVLKLSLARGRW